MINSINVYKDQNVLVDIKQTEIKRDWMEETAEKHAYKCFPVSLANRIGWSISFLEDIEFIWDGISDTSPEHVKVIKSPKNVCNTGRANATISFNTGLFFKTDQNLSILSISPPNYFIDGAQALTSIISTSFYDDSFPVAWKITRPNKNIVIPAGFPVATLVPISIGLLCDFELNIYNKEYNIEEMNEKIARQKEWEKITRQGKFTNFYRDAVDYKGNKIGSHEKKAITLKVNDFTK